MDRLIGIPYEDRGRSLEGADCWGLARLACEMLTGKDLPDYLSTYVTAEAPEQVGKAFAEQQKDEARYAPVKRGEERAGDIVLINIAGWPAHCGVVVRPGFMIHTLQGHDSALERYRITKWERRIHGFWRPI